MKTLKISFIALTAVIALSSCKKETTAETTETTVAQTADPAVATAEIDPATAPVMTFEADPFDFGDVPANQKTTKVVEFTNTGQTPLVITNAKPSCGCTVPEYSKDPIAPGAKGSLKIEFAAPATNGTQSKTVTLTTNTAKVTEIFKFTANVVGGADKPQVQPQQPMQPQNLPAPNLEAK